jgi:hypothetical protein
MRLEPLLRVRDALHRAHLQLTRGGGGGHSGGFSAGSSYHGSGSFGSGKDPNLI